MINPDGGLRKFAMLRVEGNHSIRGLPRDRIRFQPAPGSWHGSHDGHRDADIVGVMLVINAHAYSFEAGNVRHEHEWEGARRRSLHVRLMLPGVAMPPMWSISRLVAERILRFAGIVGKSGRSPGLGGRIYPDIAWAKLEALAQGRSWPAGNCG